MFCDDGILGLNDPFYNVLINGKESYLFKTKEGLLLTALIEFLSLFPVWKLLILLGKSLTSVNGSL